MNYNLLGALEVLVPYLKPIQSVYPSLNYSPNQLSKKLYETFLTKFSIIFSLRSPYPYEFTAYFYRAKTGHNHKIDDLWRFSIAFKSLLHFSFEDGNTITIDAINFFNKIDPLLINLQDSLNLNTV